MNPMEMNTSVKSGEDSKPAPSPVLQDVLAGMQPAFYHLRTGEAHLAQSKPGIPGSVYGFTGLPDDWIVERDENGSPVALHPDVIAGYWRDAKFIALSQLKNIPLDG